MAIFTVPPNVVRVPVASGIKSIQSGNSVFPNTHDLELSVTIAAVNTSKCQIRTSPIDNIATAALNGGSGASIAANAANIDVVGTLLNSTTLRLTRSQPGSLWFNGSQFTQQYSGNLKIYWEVVEYE
jgi:hypothetical protein